MFYSVLRFSSFLSPYSPAYSLQPTLFPGSGSGEASCELNVFSPLPFLAALEIQMTISAAGTTPEDLVFELVEAPHHGALFKHGPGFPNHLSAGKLKGFSELFSCDAFCIGRAILDNTDPSLCSSLQLIEASDDLS